MQEKKEIVVEEFFCPKCNVRIYPNYSNCPNCKEEIDWSENDITSQNQSQKSDIIMESGKKAESKGKNVFTLISSIIAIIFSILGLINLLNTGFSNNLLFDVGRIAFILMIFLWGISGFGKIKEKKGQVNNDKNPNI
jgi:hypothetical protein